MFSGMMVEAPLAYFFETARKRFSRDWQFWATLVGISSFFSTLSGSGVTSLLARFGCGFGMAGGIFAIGAICKAVSWLFGKRVPC